VLSSVSDAPVTAAAQARSTVPPFEAASGWVTVPGDFKRINFTSPRVRPSRPRCRTYRTP